MGEWVPSCPQRTGHRIQQPAGSGEEPGDPKTPQRGGQKPGWVVQGGFGFAGGLWVSVMGRGQRGTHSCKNGGFLCARPGLREKKKEKKNQQEEKKREPPPQEN